MPGKKEWTVIPAWRRVKDEILDARQICQYWLSKCQQQPMNINARRSFVAAVLHYYNVLKPKIKKHCKEIPTIFKQLDKISGIPSVPSIDAWIKIFHKIDNICEEIGVTKIEMPSEEVEPGQDILEGLEL